VQGTRRFSHLIRICYNWITPDKARKAETQPVRSHHTPGILNTKLLAIWHPLYFNKSWPKELWTMSFNIENDVICSDRVLTTDHHPPFTLAISPSLFCFFLLFFFLYKAQLHQETTQARPANPYSFCSPSSSSKQHTQFS
jgi:hypothetical protein